MEIEIARALDSQIEYSITYLPTLHLQIQMNAPRLKLHPFSPAQKSLWFINRLTPQSVAYDVLAAYQLNKDVNEANLTEAINKVTRRHPILLCGIEHRDGEEYLAENRYASIEPKVIELSDEKWRKMPECISASNFAPFDYEREPLFQVYLYRSPSSPPVLLFRSHHIICEYWSLGIISREWQLIYQGIIEKRPVNLPEVSSYFEFIEWQKRFLKTPDAKKSLEYWRHKLEKAPHIISLPYDFQRPESPSLKGGAVSFELPNEKLKSIVKLGKSHGVTLYSTILSAFCALLHRYSGQSEMLIGAATLGRPNSAFRKSTGYYVNTVAIKANMEGNPAFIELMKEIGSEVKESFEQQRIPFSMVVDRVNPKRNASVTPLYQVLFDIISPERFKRIIERTVGSSNKVCFATHVNWTHQPPFYGGILSRF